MVYSAHSARNCQRRGVCISTICSSFLTKKKALNREAIIAQGKAIYNYRCYFCHGYSGDAKTLASSYLDPKPVAFTQLTLNDLSMKTMRQVLQHGKANTAMMSFSSLLSEAEIEAVILFVRETFMAKKMKNTQYHTAENGWANHEKYRDAFPFVLGDIALNTDVELLTSAQKHGKELYLSACISCHDRNNPDESRPIWQSYPLSWPRNRYSHKEENQHDATSQASPYGQHDIKIVYEPKSKMERLGQQIFQSNCAFCHAADGSGKHWIGQFIEPHARDFTQTSIQKLFSKQSLKEKINRGVEGSAMPAWRYVLSDKEVNSLVSFMWLRFK